MIRFVDMRAAEIAGVRFAFWNTSTDRFVEIGGEQAWDDWEDVQEAARLGPVDDIAGGLARLQGLADAWVFVLEPEEDELCALPR